MKQVEKMEQLFHDCKEQSLGENFFKKLAKRFSYSNNRAGKPILKWTEVRSWFQKKRKNSLLKETSFDSATENQIFHEVVVVVGRDIGVLSNKLELDSTKKRVVKLDFDRVQVFLARAHEKGRDISKLEFEARSSADGAWYDEVCVRYVGFGAEEDEWVNVKNNVRERSIALEHSECDKLNVGDRVVCFQERQDQARYYDAHVVSIQRRLHDIRGCRCLFLIRYDHHKTESTLDEIMLPA
ncbi:hypothetical protein OROMI_008709 [Orobanche minor]